MDESGFRSPTTAIPDEPMSRLSRDGNEVISDLRQSRGTGIADHADADRNGRTLRRAEDEIRALNQELSTLRREDRPGAGLPRSYRHERTTRPAEVCRGGYLRQTVVVAAEEGGKAPPTPEPGTVGHRAMLAVRCAGSSSGLRRQPGGFSRS